MKLMLTACSMSSTDMRMRTALRRARTPYIPREKRMVLSTRKPLMGITPTPPPRLREEGRRKEEGEPQPSSFDPLPSSSSFPLFAAGQDDGPHQRHQEHQGGYLKRESPGPE